MKSRFLTASVLVALVAPLVAAAQQPLPYPTQSYSQFFSMGGSVFGGPLPGCVGTITCVAGTILFIINSILVPVLFAIAFIVFIYGVFKAYIWSNGDSTAVGKGHYLILWGLVGFAVMISIWGLVNVVANTFGLGGYFAPRTPTSISPGSSPAGFSSQQPPGGFIQTTPTPGELQ